MVYWPGGSDGASYTPDAFVFATRAALVPALVMVTVALATTALVASDTVPVTSAV
jgi:hypothetical protein